ncbi:MAG: GtrA family protein [Bacillota bacterium]|nr:GtrA family protein [Bacillota bacterium]
MIKIFDLFLKHKEKIAYVFWGGVTTLVNIGTYYIFAHILHIGTMISTTIAWILAILVAYITNKLYVFNSKSFNANIVIREFISFVICRLLTWGIDLATMYIFVNILKFNDMIIKTLSNVVVIIINYILSKLVIFKNQAN